ncbi:MAG: hypothetical protein WC449_02260 [Candidatus Paceibacterota bacterium]
MTITKPLTTLGGVTLAASSNPDWHLVQKMKIASQRQQNLKHEKKETDQWKKWH